MSCCLPYLFALLVLSYCSEVRFLFEGCSVFFLENHIIQASTKKNELLDNINTVFREYDKLKLFLVETIKQCARTKRAKNKTASDNMINDSSISTRYRRLGEIKNTLEYIHVGINGAT